jgi:mono/diheme cytochrome c family protein
MSDRPFMTLGCALVLAALPLDACDDRDAFHRPDPGLERMQLQPKIVAYASPMQRPPEGTFARATGDRDDDALQDDTRIRDGRDGQAFVTVVPIAVTRALLGRGRADFDRVCATCHGVVGDGVSVVAGKMESRRPPSLHEARIRALPAGMLYDVVTRGYGLMPPFTALLDARARWGVVAYVQALQLSQSARADDLPPRMQRELAREAP